MGFQRASCLQFFRGHAPWLLAMRWLALSLLWQGPIPCCHSHELWAGADEEAHQVSVACDVNWPLLDHLYTFHSADRESTARSIGWHLHWVMPEVDEGAFPPGPAISGLPGAEPSVILTDGQVSTFTTATIAWVPCEWGLVSGLVASAGDVRSLTPRHFLDTFAASLAMPLRLGIMRC